MTVLDIQIDEKKFSVGGNVILENIKLHVNSGEFVAIVGPSGAGKSTMLNMIAGLEKSDKNQIHYNHVPLSKKTPYKLSYIFQQPRLMPWLTVSENLRLVLPAITDDRIKELLEQVELKGKEHVYPKQLSGGMQRRVSIARAFINKPELLLLDEPFISLDAPSATRLRALLHNLWVEYKPTILFVTHDLSEAIQLSDRIVFLSSSPASLLLEVKVDLPRPRQNAGRKEQIWESNLLRQYSGLLEGVFQADHAEIIAGEEV